MRWISLQDKVIRSTVFRDTRLRAELIDLVVDIIVINGEKSLYEVLLSQLLTAGINAHENLCHVLLGRLGVNSECRQGVNGKVEQVIQVCFDCFLFIVGQESFSVSLPASIAILDELPAELRNIVICIRLKNSTDSANPLRIPLICLCPDCKLASERIEGYPDLPLGVVFILDLDSGYGRQQSGQTLLSIDNQIIRLDIGLVVCPDMVHGFVTIRRLPKHNVSYRIALQH